MSPAVHSAPAEHANELEGAFDDLANVTDLRKGAPPEVHRGDTSKLLAVIEKTAAFSAHKMNQDERDHMATLKSTAQLRMRNQPWYHNGKYLLIAGMMSVLAAGLITCIIVLVSSR